MDRLTEHENLVAAQTEDLIISTMDNSERSRWSADHKIGVSDIGHCREYLRRMLMQEEPSQVVTKAAMSAFVGTAVGDMIERHLRGQVPEALIQQEVIVSLEVGKYQLNLPGHPDIILPKGHGNEVRDIKTKDGLALVQRGGPTTQQRFQLALYGKGAIDAGLVERENLVLTLVYLDRSGTEGAHPEVYSWLYDEAEITEATEWLEDVFYSIENEEESVCDKPRDWCLQWCPYGPTCCGSTSRADGLITDEETTLAIKVYSEAQKAESKARRDKESAKAVLQGISGNTATHELSWTHVPTSETPCTEDSHVRRAHDRINLRERKHQL